MELLYLFATQQNHQAEQKGLHKVDLLDRLPVQHAVYSNQLLFCHAQGLNRR